MVVAPPSATLVGALAVFLSLLWLIILLWPGRWHYYQDIAMLYIFDVGLYSVNLKKGAVGAGISNLSSAGDSNWKGKIVDLLKAFESAAESLEGENNIGDVRNIFCAIKIPGVTDELCQMWTNLQYGGFAMMGLGIFTVLCLLTGAFFNHYFWNTCPTEKGRTWAKVFLWAAPISALSGVGQYLVFTKLLQGNVVAGGSSEFCINFCIGCCFSVLSCLPAFITGCNGMDDVPCDSKEMAEPMLSMADGGGGYGPGYGATANTEAGYGYGASPPGMEARPPEVMPPPMGMPPPPMSNDPQVRPGPSSVPLS